MRKLKVLPSLVLFATLTAHANSGGVISFYGNITESTCSVSIKGDEPNATLKLPNIRPGELNKIGETAGATSFNILLNNCKDSLSTGSAFFASGVGVNSMTGRLNSSGLIEGVSLQLREGLQNSTVIRAGDQAEAKQVTFNNISSGYAELPYVVEYYAEDSFDKAGIVSLVTYAVQYK